MKPLQVGLVGAGWIAFEHGKAWQSNAARARVVAVADVSPERAEYFANTYTGGNAEIHPGIESLLADPNVQAVDICLPHHLHAPAILAAARAGKAILCEKPLCTSLAEAAEIGRVLEETGVPFMLAHNQLFQPSLIEARRLLAMGAIGRPFVFRSIEASQNRNAVTGWTPASLAGGESAWDWRLDPNRMGGGEVVDTGWHGIYRLLSLVNDRPIEVSAVMERYLVQRFPAEDSGLVVIKFASGQIGELLTSWAFNPVNNWSFEILGETGSLAGNSTSILHQLAGWSEPVVMKNEPVHTFAAEVSYFLDVVQDGAAPVSSFAHAARVLQVIQAAYRAAAEKRTMTLPEDPLQAAEPAANDQKPAFTFGA